MNVQLILFAILASFPNPYSSAFQKVIAEAAVSMSARGRLSVLIMCCVASPAIFVIRANASMKQTKLMCVVCSIQANAAVVLFAVMLFLLFPSVSVPSVANAALATYAKLFVLSPGACGIAFAACLMGLIEFPTKFSG
jgi:hypothetical protein